MIFNYNVSHGTQYSSWINKRISHPMTNPHIDPLNVENWSEKFFPIALVLL